MNKRENTYQTAIYQTANHLAELLRSCPEYTHYMDAKERLLNDPVNKQILEDLRQKQFDLEDNSSSNEELAKRQKFFDDFLMSVALNPAINDFLNAEYNFGRIIEQLSDIFEQIFPEDELTEELEILTQEATPADNNAGVEATYIN